MSQEVLCALIGVAGTFLGTILGFILGKLNFGRLHFYFSNIDNVGKDFKYSPDYLKEKNGPVRLKEMDLNFDLRIYNSSDKRKVIHNCEILLMNDKGVLQTRKVHDPNTVKSNSIMSTADNITALNIDERTAINIPIKTKFEFNSKNIDGMLHGNKIVLRYKNKRFRTKFITIKNINISKQPRIKEEQTDGQA